MPKFTRDDCVASLRRVASECGEWSNRGYGANRRGSDPSPRTICNIFGTWEAAVAAAKGEPARTIATPVLPTSADEAIVAGLMKRRGDVTKPPTPHVASVASQHAAFVGAMDAAAKPSNDVYDRARSQSKLCAVVSDIHWPHVRAGCWNAYREWHADHRPDTVVINGDALDFEPLSRHPKGSNSPTEIASSIETFVAEINVLASQSKRCVVQPGNHERRLAHWLGGATPYVLKGLKGLTLHEICLAHGLRRDVEWYEESTSHQGFRFADFLIRHGDGQSSRFGGGMNPAQTHLRRSFGQSVAIGHTHRAGIATATAGGRTYFGIANGCFEADAEYAPDPAWERSFLVLEAMAPDYSFATPNLVIFQGERFSYAGKTYGMARAA